MFWEAFCVSQERKGAPLGIGQFGPLVLGGQRRRSRDSPGDTGPGRELARQQRGTGGRTQAGVGAVPLEGQAVFLQPRHGGKVVGNEGFRPVLGGPFLVGQDDEDVRTLPVSEQIRDWHCASMVMYS